MPEPTEVQEQVYIMSQIWSVSSEDPFHSSCIDSAPQKSVIGLGQAEAYYNILEVPLKFSNVSTKSTFSFETHKHTGLGILNI